MKRRHAGVAVAAVLAVLGASDRAQPAHAQIEDRPSQRPFVARAGTSVPAGLEVLRVWGNIYVVGGAGGHVVVQTGPHGVLLVDTGRAATSGHVLEAVRAITDGVIRYIINTTPEADHYGGNEAVAKAGWSPTVALPALTGEGARPAPPADDPRTLLAMVIGHEGLLNRLSAPGPGGVGTVAPFASWPTNTFFTSKKTMSFNQEGIEIRHEPKAHTDGDVVVFFRKSDVVAAGDLIDTEGYPRFDAARGGSLQGVLAGLNDIIDISIPEFNQQGGTRIVPGHGHVMNETDVADYRDMVTIIRDRVQMAVDKKLTLAETQALRPTLDYDGLYSRPSWTGEMFVEAIYRELSAGSSAAAPPQP